MAKRIVETNPVKVIRQKCVACTCGQVKEIRLCPSVDCPLWPWRMGINPYRKPLTAKQRRARMDNLEKAKRSANGVGEEKSGMRETDQKGPTGPDKGKTRTSGQL